MKERKERMTDRKREREKKRKQNCIKAEALK